MPSFHAMSTSPHLNMHSAPSQNSEDWASTTAQQGSIGTQAFARSQHAHRDEHFEGKKEERLKIDLAGIGAQFDKQK